MTLTFAVFDHQRKGRALGQALQDAGHLSVDTPRADVLLIDFDAPYAHPRPQLIEECVEHGGIVLVYPHGAYPTCQYGSSLTADPRVTAQLVQGPGIAEVYRRLGMTVPVHVVGWYYCPLLPFQPVEKIRRVLFCPAHPSGVGYLCDEMKAENARVFETLLAFGAELQVTLLGTPEMNGLWYEPNVVYRASDLNLQWGDIDQADLVVAEGTKAYLAVARGKPVVMLAQDYAPRGDLDPSPIPGWDELCPMMKYPLAFDDLDSFFHEQATVACAGSAEVTEWRARMIGEPWQPAEFVQLVERLYEESR